MPFIDSLKLRLVPGILDSEHHSPARQLSAEEAHDPAQDCLHMPGQNWTDFPTEVLLAASPELSLFGTAPQGCQLGNREWTVVYHDPEFSEDRISKLERELRDFKADARLGFMATSAPGAD
ncbi:hypothetical protein WJX77_012199 [Trebouxia sp. C0004]